MNVNKAIIFFLVLLTMTSCNSIPVRESGPLIVRAVPKSSEDTSWYRDYCTHGQPVNNDTVSYGDSCRNNQVLHHAFLYKVRLSNVYGLNGDYFGNNIYAGMPGGQRVFWNQRNQEEEYFILQRVSQEFTNDTQIKFLMTPVSYDKRLNCVGSFGFYPHTDFRACPEKDFHQGDYDACIPINDVLEHFSGG